jgi:hypothetical protein
LPPRHRCFLRNFDSAIAFDLHGTPQKTADLGSLRPERGLLEGGGGGKQEKKESPAEPPVRPYQDLSENTHSLSERWLSVSKIALSDTHSNGYLIPIRTL